ncbi:hypothetical protein PVAND_011801 [Polypedilum vanderplanki]|uniref:ATP-binding cassette sub-family B member 6 N-terminal five TM domain-containing protein n=1 Tax=Polypedilum vanderplanki TaxID=319348 RepID=A0A9J6CJQ7_POLVA|nr:hypothetical protein PVAND_011801 [Polypedilum vanderplanki]
MNFNITDFCPKNISFSDIWINHSLNQCFFDTVSSSILAAYILIFGTIQIVIYRKYATRIADRRLQSSFFYSLQLFLMLLLPILCVVRLILRWKVYEPSQIYGYMIAYTILSIFGYMFAICLILKERHYQLPATPSRGHGLTLLFFFTLVFICQNLALVNLNGDNWWFAMKSRTDKIEMGLFITRYICTLFVFVLGLKAPGIQSIATEEESSLVTEENDNAENRSTFRNAYKKMKTLFPYLWPKKNFLLQARVIFCFVLLIAGRMINVYVPIYNKKIVDSLSGENATFRWDWICIYVAFKFLQVK